MTDEAVGGESAEDIERANNDDGTDRTERPTGGLVAALAAAKLEMGRISRGRVAKIDKKAGGSFSYSYADLGDALEAVTESLSLHGIVLVQPIDTDERDRTILRTELLHVSGEAMRATMVLPVDGLEPRDMGSVLTYYRRYAALAMLGVATTAEDDDGANAGRARHGRSADRTSDYSDARPVYDADRQAALRAQIERLGTDSGKAVMRQRFAEASMPSIATRRLTIAQLDTIAEWLRELVEDEPFEVDNTIAEERADSHESTDTGERAAESESTEGTERAASGESAEGKKRAVQLESTVRMERADNSESTATAEPAAARVRSPKGKANERACFALFKKLGIDTREARLTYISELLGEPIASTSVLTDDQLDDLRIVLVDDLDAHTQSSATENPNEQPNQI